MRRKLMKFGVIGALVAVVALALVGTTAQAQGWGNPGPRGNGFGGNDVLAIAAKVIGISQTDLETALQGGKTIADVAKDKGVDLSKIVDAILEPAAAQLKTSVTAGRLTQDQADAELALQKANLTARLSQPYLVRGPQNSMLTTVAKTLGITEQELMTALQGGKSIADVAKDKNVDLSKIVDAIVAEHTTLLTAEVTAGRLTQAQADAMTALLKANLDQMLNQKFSTSGFGRGIGPRGQRGQNGQNQPPFGFGNRGNGQGMGQSPFGFGMWGFGQGFFRGFGGLFGWLFGDMGGMFGRGNGGMGPGMMPVQPPQNATPAAPATPANPQS